MGPITGLICTCNLCNAPITMRGNSIIKKWFVKSDWNYEFEHLVKMSLDVYKCIKFTKEPIEKEYPTPFSLLYDQEII
jgi:hypothetical protein